ncbi:MAG: preprotein translocase subunit SecF, partial [Myxococcota bacterium]
MITRIKDTLDGSKINFVGFRSYAAILSVLMVLGSWGLVFAVGPNWGIDFTGGTELKLGFEDDVTIADVRSAISSIGLSDDAVQQVSGGQLNEFDIRIQDASFGAEKIQSDIESRLIASFGEDWIQGEPRFDAQVGARLSVIHGGDPVTPQQVADALTDLDGVQVEPGREFNEIVVKMPGLPQVVKAMIAEAMGDSTFEVLSIDAVGPKVGGDLRTQGLLAIIATLALVLLYVGFRFDIAFAPGAILALVHDVSITIGIFVILQREINLPMIGALLTIVGYSLNDTIVIYDRIRENMDRYARTELPELINTSINETLSRTLATSVTTGLA